MLILALDTAMNGCSAALYDADLDRVLSKQSVPMVRGQAEALVPIVEDVISSSGKTYKDIDLVAVTRGPGAFTGMRVGLSFAKSLSLALECPVVGVSTLEAMAHTAVGQAIVLSSFNVVIETKRSDFYIQSFDEKGYATSDPEALESDVIFCDQSRPLFYVGDGVLRLESQLPDQWCDKGTKPVCHTINLLDVACVARIACKMKQSGIAQHIEPLYIRNADVSFSSKKNRKIKQ